MPSVYISSDIPNTESLRLADSVLAEIISEGQRSGKQVLFLPKMDLYLTWSMWEIHNNEKKHTDQMLAGHPEIFHATEIVDVPSRSSSTMLNNDLSLPANYLKVCALDSDVTGPAEPPVPPFQSVRRFPVRI